MSHTNYNNNVAPGGCLFMFAQIYFKQQQGDLSHLGPWRFPGKNASRAAAFLFLNKENGAHVTKRMSCLLFVMGVGGLH